MEVSLLVLSGGVLWVRSDSFNCFWRGVSVLHAWSNLDDNWSDEYGSRGHMCEARC